MQFSTMTAANLHSNCEDPSNGPVGSHVVLPSKRACAPPECMRVPPQHVPSQKAAKKRYFHTFHTTLVLIQTRKDHFFLYRK